MSAPLKPWQMYRHENRRTTSIQNFGAEHDLTTSGTNLNRATFAKADTIPVESLSGSADGSRHVLRASESDTRVIPVASGPSGYYQPPYCTSTVGPYSSTGGLYGRRFGNAGGLYGDTRPYDNYSWSPWMDHNRFSRGAFPGDMSGVEGVGWMGRTADSLGRFSQLLDINSWFIDQICDNTQAVVYRMHRIFSGFNFVKGATHPLALSCGSLMTRIGFCFESEENDFESWASTSPRQSIDSKGSLESFSRSIQRTSNGTDYEKRMSRSLSFGGWETKLRTTLRRLRYSVVLCVLFLFFGAWRLFVSYRGRRSRRENIRIS